jgi:uncharacterized OB-fold protein
VILARSIEVMSAERPIPHSDAMTEPYWAGARARRLLMPRCGDCGKYHFYPRSLCPHCSSAHLEWQQVSGAGTLYSYTIVNRAPSPAFAPEVPYVVAIVELDEGPHLMSNLVGCAPAAATIGMKLKVAFREVGENSVLPVFEPE